MSARSTGAALVMVTAASEEQAASIARTLVEERLAACVNLVGAIRSIYRWQGAVQDDREQLMLIKTRASMLPALERRVKELHTYDLPEVIALPIAAGSKPYLDWVIESTPAAPKRRAGRRR